MRTALARHTSRAVGRAAGHLARLAERLNPPYEEPAHTCRTCDAPAVHYAPGFGWVCANTGH
ncbi:hypothetical protein ACQP2T_61635 [Nonomuraea sp. CA-143628]|uniref:hypothetical protein n=1 Tax=Nonomuraea sp. CA-143628 TaxID=3239997 RepID=UPI003D89E28E